jgi:hypothetical protein
MILVNDYSRVNGQPSGSSLSPRDIVMSQKFKQLKEKYWGQNSRLVIER